MQQTNINAASVQWATRPDDQRFLSLEELQAHVDARKERSWTETTDPDKLRIIPANGNRLAVQVFDYTKGENRELEPTNWAFGQLSRYASAPAAYIRKLPAQLAAINLQWGLEHIPERENVLTLSDEDTLRAMTSTTYGRIYDAQVVQAVRRVNQNGNWKIPAASYQTQNPRRATTLYASDRDVFIFLVDDEHPIEVDGEQLFRGFITGNSEVGAASFWLTTFLYRFVCDNRIIWGPTNIRELRIRHTGGAPERFGREGSHYLTRYANEATAAITDTIKQAKNYEIPNAEKPGDGWEKWLKDRGFTATVSREAVQTAQAEEGQARSLWDIVNGITAYARKIQTTDDRVELETKAGNLLNRFSKN